MSERCVRCGEEGQDRRTLRMSCFYEMDELDIPLEKSPSCFGPSYTMRVCKRCRGEWMAAIKAWFHEEIESEESCGSGIFIREFGKTVELTEEEWARRNPGREPIRFHG